MKNFDNTNVNCKKNKPSEGQYANCFQIGQNEFEFVLDFGQSYDENGKENYHTRIICNPYYVSILLKLLQSSVKKHEEMYGQIEKN
ncbi:MAG: DUF3467 domain-containing protein [Candidatus Kuenenia sp.]|nr:DUF3467 domain-containing protein [Candidatus Kuenenia hertensis]